jgi:hypothetical protein
MALLSRKILEGYRSRISTKLGDSGSFLATMVYKVLYAILI